MRRAGGSKRDPAHERARSDKTVAAATIRAGKALYERQIDATDRQIDALVYELYGLTEKEIAVVEGSQEADGQGT